MIHFDFECAKCSQRIADAFQTGGEKAAKEAESAITRALGVLQEDGLYAFYLYMKAKKTAALYSHIETVTVDFLRTHSLVEPDTATDGLSAARALCSDLDQLLFSKELLERILVYARYHAKAGGGNP